MFTFSEAFQPDMFHMGGDEVSERCWNSSQEIQQFMIQNRWDLDKASFLKLWNYFQKKAQDKAYKVNILWGKHLFKNNLSFDKYSQKMPNSLVYYIIINYPVLEVTILDI